MKTNFLFYFLSFFTYTVIYAQAPEIEWQNTIGGTGSDELKSIKQTNDGGYILGGSSTSNVGGDKTEASNNYDYWVVKLDSIGSIEWQNTIGGFSDDFLNSIQQTIDGGYILGGYSNSGVGLDKTEPELGPDPTSDYWVIKLDSIGDIEWQNTIGGSSDDFLREIHQTNDKGYILGGTSSSGVSGDKTESLIGSDDYWIVKLDSIGNIEWQNTIGGTSFDDLFSIAQTANEGYILGGTSLSGISGDKTEESLSPGYTDYWVVKLDSIGSIEWQNTIGGSSNDGLNSIHETFEGGYILGGYSYSGISGDKTEGLVFSPFPDYWIIKLDSTGSIEWQNDIGGSATELYPSIAPINDGGYIVAGWSNSEISGDKSESFFGGYDYWVVRLEPSGSVVWENTIGGSGDDYPTIISQTSDSGFIVGGYSSSGITYDKTEELIGLYDYWVIKLSAECDFIAYYEDADEDGYGNNLMAIYSCEMVPGYVTDSTDCDDTNAGVHPGAEEICNSIDENCNGINNDGLPLYTYYHDEDEDGYGDVESYVQKCFDFPPPGFVTDSTDCDDFNELIHEPVLYYADADGDLYGDVTNAIYFCSVTAPPGYTSDSTDCDDSNELIHEPALYYADADGDLFGDESSIVFLCELTPPTGYVIDNTDCDDLNSLINPSSAEVCNEIDDNCNLAIDEGLSLYTYFIDADADEYGNVLFDSITCLTDLPGYVPDSTDCDDTNPDIYPGATEILNGLDDDCDNQIDENLVGIENKGSYDFEIYPNPNDGDFIIKIQNINSNNLIVEAYSLIGNRIYSKEFYSIHNLFIQLPESFSGVANVVVKFETITINKSIYILK